MSNVAFEITAIFLLLIANGVFATSKIAVVTARKSRLQEFANNGVARARTALELAEHPDRFLSTVQIGITLVGILAGAFGGGGITSWLSARLQSIPMLAECSRPIAVVIVVLIITYFFVFLGELVPKRLALSHPESIAMFMAPLIRSILTICAPVVRFLTSSRDVVLGYSASASTNKRSSRRKRLLHLFGKARKRAFSVRLSRNWLKQSSNWETKARVA